MHRSCSRSQGRCHLLVVAHCSVIGAAMDIADRVFVTNLDWDPQYLMECVTQDFYDFTEHWQNCLSDKELIDGERYCLLVEDISLDDDTLYEAVEQIEQE